MRRILLLILGFLVSILLLTIIYTKTGFISQSGKQLGVKTQYITGGIIPHHLLVTSYINDFLNQIKDQNPKTIILIGPNHFEKGNKLVITTKIPWETDFGTLESNSTIIDSLISSGLVFINDQFVYEEHSIHPLTPLIKRIIPNTTIVPLVVSNRMNKRDIELFSDELSRHINPNTVIIAAVDFSHYLKTHEAYINDEKTISFINQGNIDEIIKLNNEYLDSPSSIALFVQIMNNKNTTYSIINHGNSGEILSDPLAETTSYFEIIYFQN